MKAPHSLVCWDLRPDVNVKKCCLMVQIFTKVSSTVHYQCSTCIHWMFPAFMIRVAMNLPRKQEFLHLNTHVYVFQYWHSVFSILQLDTEEEGWRCTLWPKSVDPELEVGQSLCYLPMCCLLISRWPYFTLMKDLISRYVLVSLRLKNKWECI